MSATNMGYDAYAYIDAFPVDAVSQLHLGGFTPEPDAGGRSSSTRTQRRSRNPFGTCTPMHCDGSVRGRR